MTIDIGREEKISGKIWDAEGEVMGDGRANGSEQCFYVLSLVGVELFPESDAQFLTETVEVLEVLLVLLLVLDLGLDTCWGRNSTVSLVSRGREG